MKNRKKVLIFAIGMLLLAGLLAGCKKVTAESLLKEAAANMQKAKSLSGNMGMEMEVGMEQSGTSIALNAKLDVDMEMTNKPAAMHLNGKADVDLMNLSLDIESYSMEEDGKNITYTKVGEDWNKTESEPKKEDKDSNMDFLSGINKDKLVLQKETSKVNKKEAYVIKADLTGEDFKEAESQIKEYLDKMKLGKADLSKLSLEVTLKIYKDTKLPASISLKVVDGMNDLLKGLTGESEANLTMDKCVIDVTFDAYDKVKEIKIPKEAKNAKSADDAAAAPDDLTDTGSLDSEEEYTVEAPVLDESGYYNIEGYGKTLKVKAPEGYEYSDTSNKNILGFSKSSGDYSESAFVNYQVDEYYDEYEQYAVESQKEAAERYTEENGFTEFELQDVKTMDVSGMSVNYIFEGYKGEERYSREYRIWTVLSDNRVAECRVALDSTNKINVGDEAAFITTMMSGIQP